MLLCPECEAGIDDEEELDEGEVVECPKCGAELEVTSGSSLELETLVIDDDFEDDDFEDDDFADDAYDFDDEEWD